MQEMELFFLKFGLDRDSYPDRIRIRNLVQSSFGSATLDFLYYDP
jgi:hypothetical protein